MQTVEMAEFDEEERVMREASLAYHRHKKQREQLTAEVEELRAAVVEGDKAKLLIADLRQEIDDLRTCLSVVRAHLDAYGIRPPEPAHPHILAVPDFLEKRS